jgi:hypothetical protein
MRERLVYIAVVFRLSFRVEIRVVFSVLFLQHVKNNSETPMDLR